jgi:hypothetical protein
MSKIEKLLSLDEIEALAAPLVPIKEESMKKRKLEREEMDREEKRRMAAQQYKPTTLERNHLYIQQLVQGQMSGSPDSTFLDRDLPIEFVEELVEKDNICKLIQFKFGCRGVGHLGCHITSFLSRATVHHYGQCKKCYELNRFIEKHMSCEAEDESDDEEESHESSDDEE